MYLFKKTTLHDLNLKTDILFRNQNLTLLEEQVLKKAVKLTL